MAETIYTPIKRKPLSPGATVQLPPRSGDSLLGDHKLRQSTASNVVLHGESGYAVAPKTAISVHFLRLATIAFTLMSLGFAAWIMYYTHMSVDKWTQSTVIGGNFSQPQAKIIDFLASAIAAPMIIAIFNYVSFQIARACVLDTEAATSTFTVKALVEVGTTTFGSYDPFKLATLLATSKLRVMLLAVAAILSAVSFSTLTNVIAYEAFQTSASDQSSVRLDYLYSPPGQSAAQKSENEGILTNQMPAISSINLLFEFTSQYFEVMTTLSFKTAESFLEDGKYIGINATNASLSAVPSSVDKLFNVPAYQLSYTCVPALAQNIKFLLLVEVNDILRILLDLDIPNSRPNTTFEAYMMNGDSSVMGGFLSAATFVAFDTSAAATKSFYLGVFSDSLAAADSTFSFSEFTIESAFGPLKNTIFNNTAVGGYPYTNMYGVACEVHHRVGTVDLSRKSNSSTWTRSSGEFAPNHNELSLIMPDLQVFPNFVGPVSKVMPGIGGGLAASTNVVSVANYLNKTNNFEDFDSFAMNYLYAEGESRRIAYEVAQSAPGHQGTSYKVQATRMMLRYQIMFVPWILLVGLLTMAFAGICVLLLILLARGSIGSRAGRIVSPLRLMVDAVAGLSRDEFTEISAFEQAELEKWSKRFKVQYNTANEDGRMKLQSVGSVKWALHEED